MHNHILPWFAIQVRSQYESVVYTSLTSKEYDVFLPTIRSRHSTRTRTKDAPLFPGYLFCRLSMSNRLPVLITPGVIRIVGSGGVPIPVDNPEIQAVQAIANSGREAVAVPFATVGERVRIEKGPLQGVEGILLSLRGSRRLVVSVSLLQRSVAVEIDSEYVVPCAGTPKRASGRPCALAVAAESRLETSPLRNSPLALCGTMMAAASRADGRG